MSATSVLIFRSIRPTVFRKPRPLGRGVSGNSFTQHRFGILMESLFCFANSGPPPCPLTQGRPSLRRTTILI
jgi:hypothetical protein